jgi:hypothetical protein
MISGGLCDALRGGHEPCCVVSGRGSGRHGTTVTERRIVLRAR